MRNLIAPVEANVALELIRIDNKFRQSNSAGSTKARASAEQNVKWCSEPSPTDLSQLEFRGREQFLETRSALLSTV